MPSIALEAVADYHLFFWYISYGNTGNTNDRTILSLSPLLDRLLDGSFQVVERAPGVVPFVTSDQNVNETWITVVGIYPQYSRFQVSLKRWLLITDHKGYRSRCTFHLLK
jgi:hypothetical protein